MPLQSHIATTAHDLVILSGTFSITIIVILSGVAPLLRAGVEGPLSPRMLPRRAAVPTGLEFISDANPALKGWAKLFRLAARDSVRFPRCFQALPPFVDYSGGAMEACRDKNNRSVRLRSRRPATS